MEHGYKMQGTEDLLFDCDTIYIFCSLKNYYSITYDGTALTAATAYSDPPSTSGGYGVYCYKFTGSFKKGKTVKFKGNPNGVAEYYGYGSMIVYGNNSNLHLIQGTTGTYSASNIWKSVTLSKAINKFYLITGVNNYGSILYNNTTYSAANSTYCDTIYPVKGGGNSGYGAGASLWRINFAQGTTFQFSSNAGYNAGGAFLIY